MTPARRRLIANELCEHFDVSQRRVSRALDLARSSLRYAPVLHDEQAALARRMDELEARIADLESREELAKIRPALDGNEVMEHLGVKPGPIVGQALSFLLEIRLDEGPISKDEARERLAAWARERGIDRKA